MAAEKIPDTTGNASGRETLSPLGEYARGMNWNPLERVIFERRSVRSFRKEPLPDGMIRRILETGRFAPSAGNSQPWRFVVVNSPAVLKKMEEDAVRAVKALMWVLDYTRSPLRRLILKPVIKLVIRMQKNSLHPVPFYLLLRIASGNAPVFHGAPALILLLEDRRGVSNPSLDIGICGEHMVLAAHSMGAGACWIGMIKMLMYYPRWRRRFGVRYPYRLNECIAIGWPRHPFDGQVPREIQNVEWIKGGMDDPSVMERQGE